MERQKVERLEAPCPHGTGGMSGIPPPRAGIPPSFFSRILSIELHPRICTLHPP